MKRCPICGKEPKISVRHYEKEYAHLTLECGKPWFDHTVMIQADIYYHPVWMNYEDGERTFEQRIKEGISDLFKKWNQMK